MSKHDPKVTLRQIADCARRAQELCGGKTLDELLSDWRNTLALERVMELLGEAAKRLPADLRERVSHGYDAIDHQTLWNTVQQDIPI